MIFERPIHHLSFLNLLRIFPDLILSSSAGKVTEIFNNDGVLSWCGIISSIYGLYETWPRKKT